MEPMFEKVAAYQYSSEAIIAKGRLEAEGIEVYMADNLTIDTDPLVSNAIGGVKLFVKAGDVVKAKEVLQNISRYSVDNEGKLIACPNCGKYTVEMGTTIKDAKSLLAFIFSLGFMGSLPLYTRYKYRCNNCGHEFSIS